MILGLDVSTSCTGWSVLNQDESLSGIGYIRLDKLKDVFSKAQEVERVISRIFIDHDIQHAFIEQNLQSFRSGFSSAQTLSTLARFNGMISYIVYETTGIKPEFINVNLARNRVGIKIEKEKKCGKSTKEQVLHWVSNRLTNTDHQWPVKTLKSGPRKGQVVLETGCYDMADAYVIARAG
jgi:Holliday junction resolvasome RuvABC endonuclease subunit